MPADKNIDEDEIADLFGCRREALLGFVMRRVNNPHDAEEILQTAFVKSLKWRTSLREEKSIIAWSYQVLRNAIIDYYRRRGTRERALGRLAQMGGDPVPSSSVQPTVCKCVHGALSNIKEDYGLLLRRVDMEGQSIAQVSAQLGITANNARVKLHRARRALREQLQIHCGTCCSETHCLDCNCAQDVSPNNLSV